MMWKGAILFLLWAMLVGCFAAPGSGTAGSVGGAPAADPVRSIPGRLLFLSDRQATILAAGERRAVDLPVGLAEAAIAPDGRQVAGLLDGEIVLIDLDGGKTRLLGRTEGRGLTWSPAGGHLATHVGREGETVLEVHAIASGEVRRISIPDAGRVRVAWSPRGDRLAAQIGTGAVPDNRLWLVDLTAGTASLLAEQARTPAWSPDGAALAYVQAQQGEPDQLALWRAAAGARVAISQESLAAARPDQAAALAGNAIVYIRLSWSPSGDRLAASAKATGPNPRFVLASATPDGAVGDLWILPLHLDKQMVRPGVTIWPPRPCSTGPYEWVGEGAEIAMLMGGPGCEGKLALLDGESLGLTRELALAPGPESAYPERFLAFPAGRWVALAGADSALLIDLARPEEPIRLDGLGRLVQWSP